MSLWPRSLRPRAFLNPVSRVALATFVWNHRHEVLRWGRTLVDQLVGRNDVSPAHAVRVGRVLVAIASDDQLRNAKQLKKVTMVGDDVDLDVDESWSALPRLLDRVGRVKGIGTISVNGRATPVPIESRAAS